MMSVYTSNVSYGLLGFIFLISYGPLIPIIARDGMSNGTFIAFIFISLVYGFVLHLFMDTRYTVTDNQLLIKCGFFAYTPIAITDITEVAKTQDIISAPAPSFDRIRVKYGKYKSVVLSPKDKEAFAKHLTQLNPNIVNKINGESS